MTRSKLTRALLACVFVFAGVTLIPDRVQACVWEQTCWDEIRQECWQQEEWCSQQFCEQRDWDTDHPWEYCYFQDFVCGYHQECHDYTERVCSDEDLCH